MRSKQLLLLLFIFAAYVAPSFAQTVPELIYYKFDVPGTTVLNEASSPVTATGAVQGTATIGGVGEFNTGLVGSGATSATNSVSSGWAMNLTGAWTISMWISGVTTASNAYLFGGTGGSTFRAFTGVNYVAGAGNLLFRATGMTDVPLTGIFNATGTPVVVHLAYDPTIPAIKSYINGVLYSTVTQTATMALTGTNLLVGGYATNPALPTGGVIDEFRLYNRALDAVEITTTWNVPLPLSQTPCSGPPNAATASAPAIVCPNVSFGLSATGFSFGSGISYQWEMYNIGTSIWDPVPLATSPNALVAGGQSVTTDYRLKTICVNGGATDISNVVTVGMNQFFNCYCASAAINAFDGEITNVTVGPLNNSSTCASSNQLYTNYTGTVPATQLMQGVLYPVSVMAGSCGGSYAAYVKVFIDLDHDGTFAGVGEEVFAGIPPGGLYTPAGVAATGSITIPPTALLGTTRMRVILNQNTVAAAVTPCGTYNYGETEDYLIDVVSPQSCTGTPTPVTISGPATVCASTPFNLTSTGYTTAFGIVYQWEQYNTATSTWDPIPTATTPSYSVPTGQTVATAYRFKTTCTNGGGFDISNTLTVGMSSFLYCYCIPITTFGCGAGDHITNVTFATINNSTGLCISGGSYSTYQVTVPPPNVAQGASIPISVVVNNGGTEYAGAWIDFDQNGTFDVSEFTTLTGTLTTAWNFTGTVAVPAGATLGQTGMRVRSSYSTTVPSNSACSNTYSYGETEDYVVNIVVSPLSIKLLGITAANLGNRNRVDWSTESELAGDRFELERSADGRNFTKLTTVNAKGQASKYSYWDEAPVTGVNHYRLKMIDASGSISHSEIVKAIVKGSGSFTVEAYPNPVDDLLTVKVYGVAGNNPVLNITDVTGKVVKVITIGNNEATVDMGGMSQGLYLIKYIDDDRSQTIKINKR